MYLCLSCENCISKLAFTLQLGLNLYLTTIVFVSLRLVIFVFILYELYIPANLYFPTGPGFEFDCVCIFFCVQLYLCLSCEDCICVYSAKGATTVEFLCCASVAEEWMQAHQGEASRRQGEQVGDVSEFASRC